MYIIIKNYSHNNKKKRKNLKRGVHFCLFYRFYILIFSFLRSVHPPHKNALLYVHFRGGVHASLFLYFQYFIPINGQKCTPPLKNSHEKNIQNTKETIFSVHFVFSVFKYTLSSQVRSRSVSGPFQVRSYEWEVNGTYNGFTTDLLGRYI